MASVFNFRCSGSSRLPQFQWPRTGPTRLPRFIEPALKRRFLDSLTACTNTAKLSLVTEKKWKERVGLGQYRDRSESSTLLSECNGGGAEQGRGARPQCPGQAGY